MIAPFLALLLLLHAPAHAQEPAAAQAVEDVVVQRLDEIQDSAERIAYLEKLLERRSGHAETASALTRALEVARAQQAAGTWDSAAIREALAGQTPSAGARGSVADTPAPVAVAAPQVSEGPPSTAVCMLFSATLGKKQGEGSLWSGCERVRRCGGH